MSFVHTTDAVLERRKTVTRRLGWEKLQAGEQLIAVDKLPTDYKRQRDGQIALGLPGVADRPSGRYRILGIIEVVSVRTELLGQITQEDVDRECVPGVELPNQFVVRFMEINRVRPPVAVRRIEFCYLDPLCATCGSRKAACLGRYDPATEAYRPGVLEDFACNVCCGHGCEDGFCQPIG